MLLQDFGVLLKVGIHQDQLLSGKPHGLEGWRQVRLVDFLELLDFNAAYSLRIPGI